MATREQAANLINMVGVTTDDYATAQRLVSSGLIRNDETEIRMAALAAKERRENDLRDNWLLLLNGDVPREIINLLTRERRIPTDAEVALFDEDNTHDYAAPIDREIVATIEIDDAFFKPTGCDGPINFGK